MTRYVILGAGGVGGTIGGALAAAGHEVVLVARGAHLEALRASGLRLVTPRRTLRPSVRSVGGPDELSLTEDDVLILAVKSQDTLPLVEQWSRQSVRPSGTSAGEALPLICAQNGVANELAALRYFERVYGVCTWLPATLAEPGVIVAEGAPGFGVLDVGRVGNLSNADRTTADADALAFADDLTEAGFAAYATSDVMPWKYGKLLRNLSNAIQAACGTTSSPRRNSRVSPRPKAKPSTGRLGSRPSTSKRPMQSVATTFTSLKLRGIRAVAGRRGRASSAGSRPLRSTI
ncbi:MAG TPA: 2-dehydropantoate 2-reductase N-terminal domain-containing protein [Propionibacteriaceae bacterium]|nr:2-dehydropantoate 2-reductase N-terminal domain-containing protein [Propionibacteriaceae bacterium]